MDFWDLSKLLVRRWWVALPMLGLTVALMAMTYGTVKPNYNMTAYVVLVPPVPTPDKQGELTQVQRNVWLSQGLLALANAASVSVLDPSVPDEMKVAGLSDSFTIDMNVTSAVITLTITAKSPEQAGATATELVRRYAGSVKALQDQSSVVPSDQVTAKRLGGTGAVESNGNVKRALAAMGGAGLLLTAGATIGVDAWLRRRARRGLEQDDMPDLGAAIPVPVPAPQPPPAPARPVQSGPLVSRSVLQAAVSTDLDSAPAGSRIPASRALNGAATPTEAAEPTRSIDVRSALVSIAGTEAERDPGDGVTRQPDREPDTTIVLPLTFGSLRPGDSGRRP